MPRPLPHRRRQTNRSRAWEPHFLAAVAGARADLFLHRLAPQQLRHRLRIAPSHEGRGNREAIGQAGNFA